jgi:hypothetical protein
MHLDRMLAWSQRLAGTRRRRQLAALLLAAACAGCNSASSRAAFDREDFALNQAQYSLPLDVYLVEPLQDEWGRNVLVSDCMKVAGFNFPVPRYSEAIQSPTRNALQRKLFTLDLAKQYGYHAGPSRAAGGYGYRPSSTKEEVALRGCQEAAGQSLNSSLEARSLVESLRTAAFMTARSSQPVRAAATRWSECMRPLAIPDLPTDPRGIDIMPTPSQRERWGLSTQADQPVQQVAAGSPEEIGFATHDAQCRESSGYSTAMYQGELQAQLDLMNQNEEALQRARENADAVSRKLQALLEKRYG